MPKYKDIMLYGGDVHIKFDEKNHAYWKLDGDNPKKNGDPRMKRLTGVTTYCGIVDKTKFLIPWAVDTTVEFVRQHIDMIQDKSGNELLELARHESDKQRDLAAEIGSAIHKWIEQYIQKEKPEMPDDPKVLEGVVSFLKWQETEKIIFDWSEKVVYSKKHGYVGTADIGIRKGESKYLVDIKTGNNLYEEVKMQTAAYLMALEEETKQDYAGRYVIRISKETEADYMKRMEDKNSRKKNPSQIKPYKIFEAVYLDEDRESLTKDYKAFLSAKRLHEWKATAWKELYNARQ